MAYASVLEIEEISTVTSKGQTTVPKPVRQALGIHAGDRIAFRVDDKGVTIRRADEQEDDPVIGAFLEFLATDIKQNPKHVNELTPDLLAKIQELTDGVAFDPDEPIEGDVSL
jgi:antitoxin PrlF